MQLLTRLKEVFRKERKLPVETFGKLPFYKDYITIAASAEAQQWKAWLLDVFARDCLRIPPGRWPFVFQHEKSRNLVTGLIEASSDGIRQFPFSVFSVLSVGRKGIADVNMTLLRSIWQELGAVRVQLDHVEDIRQCHGLVAGRNIVVTSESQEGQMGAETAVRLDVCSWPLFLVAGIYGGGPLLPVCGGKMPDGEVSRLWREVSGLADVDSVDSQEDCTQQFETP